MNKILVIILVLLLIPVSGCRQKAIVNPPATVDTKIEKEEYIKIMTTNKLLYHMVKDIVKDRHSVDYMLKTEEDQWKFDYSDDSLSNISRKDMFIYLGAGYEPWVPQFTEDLKKGKVGIVNASRGIKLLSFTNPRKYKETEIKDNPYYWLNPDNYKTIMANIKNAVQEKDPKNRDIYESNFNDSIKAIDIYLKDVKTLNENLKNYTFVAAGDDLDYFCKYFDMKVIKADESDNPVEDQDKLDKKIGDSKNNVFLYTDNSELEKYGSEIVKYNMTPVNIKIYEFDMTYQDILAYNIDALKKLSE